MPVILPFRREKQWLHRTDTMISFASVVRIANIMGELLLAPRA